MKIKWLQNRWKKSSVEAKSCLATSFTFRSISLLLAIEELMREVKWHSFINQFWYCCSVAKSCPTLQPHELQHARPPCPSPSPEVSPSSCPLHLGCYPAISSSDPLFSFCHDFYKVLSKSGQRTSFLTEKQSCLGRSLTFSVCSNFGILKLPDGRITHAYY